MVVSCGGRVLRVSTGCKCSPTRLGGPPCRPPVAPRLSASCTFSSTCAQPQQTAAPLSSQPPTAPIQRPGHASCSALACGTIGSTHPVHCHSADQRALGGAILQAAAHPQAPHCRNLGMSECWQGRHNKRLHKTKNWKGEAGLPFCVSTSRNLSWMASCIHGTAAS